ncbi:MAG TPA: winged helix-turn-helix domain-containing protein [Gemmataceae bacterium]|jgi:hypothetical protein|nr:winged helix-turn-helix domain-containing protein [Gemmataceae bacterium]
MATELCGIELPYPRDTLLIYLLLRPPRLRNSALLFADGDNWVLATVGTVETVGGAAAFDSWLWASAQAILVGDEPEPALVTVRPEEQLRVEPGGGAPKVDPFDLANDAAGVSMSVVWQLARWLELYRRCSDDLTLEALLRARFPDVPWKSEDTILVQPWLAFQALACALALSICAEPALTWNEAEDIWPAFAAVGNPATIGQVSRGSAHLAAAHLGRVVFDQLKGAGIAQVWTPERLHKTGPPELVAIWESALCKHPELTRLPTVRACRWLYARLENEWGAFLYANRQARRERQPTARPPNPTERRILSHCRRRDHKGERIARHLGLSYEHVRGVLARLVRAGLLRKTEGGYRTVRRGAT